MDMSNEGVKSMQVLVAIVPPTDSHNIGVLVDARPAGQGFGCVYADSLIILVIFLHVVKSNIVSRRWLVIVIVRTWAQRVRYG
jgi:hypothetical protein